jgi:hypothetical protein
MGGKWRKRGEVGRTGVVLPLAPTKIRRPRRRRDTISSRPDLFHKSRQVRYSTGGGGPRFKKEERKEETNLEHAVPRSRAERHPVRAHAETADPVLMPSQDADPFPLERVPDVAVEVVVAGKEQPTRDGEADRGDAAQDVVVRVLVQFAVGAEVKQPARGVVGTGRKGVAAWEEAEQMGGANGVSLRLEKGKRRRKTHETALMSDS